MPHSSAGSVDSVTERTFPTRVLQATKPVLIQFWAPWCGPCIRVTPIVEQLAAEHADTLDVVKVHVDEEPELAIRHRITSIPAFVVYADGAPVQSWTGAAPKSVLAHNLAPYLG
ncbi:thioredoxin family protein [Embleya sp. AB8]|uniref:thioredoxin family protein n=1 Tax=Embleya sp. AB8 TaxID=3156304 RepID=UPI003C72BE31